MGRVIVWTSDGVLWPPAEIDRINRGWLSRVSCSGHSSQIPGKHISHDMTLFIGMSAE